MSPLSQARVALITGGGSGMGLAVSRYLAGKGWKISSADLNQQRGESAAKELDGIFTKTDVTKYEDQAKAFSNTWDKFGRIDFGKPS
jgi:15-hydroxyprostaglandin dehydrogenase (NAD)